MRQPEALRLADELIELHGYPLSIKAAAELRRLHQSEQEGWRYANELEQERKRLHEANQAMLDALKEIWRWMENQTDGQSKGGHATFELMMMREQRDIASAAIVKGEQT